MDDIDDVERYVGGDHEMVRGEDGWLHCADEYRTDSPFPADDGEPLYVWRCPHMLDPIRFVRRSATSA